MEIKNKLVKLARAGAVALEVFVTTFLGLHMAVPYGFFENIRNEPINTMVLLLLWVWCANSMIAQCSVAVFYQVTVLFCTAFEMMAVGFALRPAVTECLEMLCNKTKLDRIKIGSHFERLRADFFSFNTLEKPEHTEERLEQYQSQQTEMQDHKNRGDVDKSQQGGSDNNRRVAQGFSWPAKLAQRCWE